MLYHLRHRYQNIYKNVSQSINCVFQLLQKAQCAMHLKSSWTNRIAPFLSGVTWITSLSAFGTLNPIRWDIPLCGSQSQKLHAPERCWTSRDGVNSLLWIGWYSWAGGAGKDSLTFPEPIVTSWAFRNSGRRDYSYRSPLFLFIASIYSEVYWWIEASINITHLFEFGHVGNQLSELRACWDSSHMLLF